MEQIAGSGGALQMGVVVFPCFFRLFASYSFGWVHLLQSIWILFERELRMTEIIPICQFVEMSLLKSTIEFS